MRSVNGDYIVAKTGPDRDAFGKVGAGVSPIGDRTGRQAGDGNLSPKRIRHLVRNHHVGITDGTGLVADQQQVAAGAGVDVEHAVHIMQVAEEEVSCAVGINVEVRCRGHVDSLVAVVQVQVGTRARALDVEYIITGAKVDVKGIDTVVIDAIFTGRHGRRFGLDILWPEAVRGDRERRGEYVARYVLDNQHAAFGGCPELGQTEHVDIIGQGRRNRRMRFIGTRRVAEGCFALGQRRHSRIHNDCPYFACLWLASGDNLEGGQEDGT